MNKNIINKVTNMIKEINLLSDFYISSNEKNIDPEVIKVLSKLNNIVSNHSVEIIDAVMECNIYHPYIQPPHPQTYYPNNVHHKNQFNYEDQTRMAEFVKKAKKDIIEDTFEKSLDEDSDNCEEIKNYKKGNGGRILTDSNDQGMVIKMRANGETYQNISRDLNMPIQTVIGILRKNIKEV